jgi:adenylate cyclase
MVSTRRLTAILAADVAGYSRLMGADEEGTLAALKALRRELSDPKIKEHHGRIVKTTGDGLLVEFGSIVDAVLCAVEVQAAMAERNADAPADKRIEFRIGINLGDIIKDRGDIFGDGVNIAARLEALAEPGRICVSRVVRDQVRDKLDLAFEDLGEHALKNIARPVRVYALCPATGTVFSTSTAPSDELVSPTLIVPRLSIVVLPFVNLSSDPEQQYFVDAITEDLTTDLSRLPDMLVISRNSAFTYQGKRVSAKEAGRELGVRYVLEGSVRRLGSRIRTNVQLIDGETDAHLWAERFDSDTTDLFALQDEITSRIAVGLDLELVRAEVGHTTEHPDALDSVLRGRAVWHRPRTRDSCAEAISLFERALTLDRRSVQAMSHLATAFAGRVLNDMTDSGAADIERAEELVEQALTQSPDNMQAHFAKGQVLRAQNRYNDAIAEYETVLALNRNWVDAYAHLGRCKFFTGSIGEVIPLCERAIRLSPRDPGIFLSYERIGQVHLVESRIDEAILWFERIRSVNPAYPLGRAFLAATYALKGDMERAALELVEAQRLSGEQRYSSIARVQASGYFKTPAIRALFENTYFAGLRKAGLPEE